ncbi:MAG: hypothetical protein FWC84_05395, partial [Alphaproteobacteria bacterium]|nr:hypothetical protein [Alphaproteobacteria bacterium]
LNSIQNHRKQDEKSCMGGIIQNPCQSDTLADDRLIRKGEASAQHCCLNRSFRAYVESAWITPIHNRAS